MPFEEANSEIAVLNEQATERTTVRDRSERPNLIHATINSSQELMI